MTSPKSIERNQKKVEELGKIFSSKGAYLFDYRGLTVGEMEDLRNKVKELDADVKVFKNRLAIKYFESLEGESLGRELFNGPMAVAFADEKFVEVAKVMADFEKESKKIQLKSAFVESQLMDRDRVIALAKLPGKDQLMAQLAMSVIHPLRKMGMAFSAPLSNMLVLLKNLKDKKEKEGEE